MNSSAADNHKHTHQRDLAEVPNRIPPWCDGFSESVFSFSTSYKSCGVRFAGLRKTAGQTRF